MNRRQFSRFAISALLVAAATPKAQASAPKEKKKGGGASFTQIPAIAVYIPRRDGRHATMTIELGLDIKDTHLREQVAAYIPRLRDAYISRVQVYAMRLRENSLADPAYITRELQAATDQVLNKKGANVLLGTLLIN